MVRVETADRVHTLTFDRPETKNAFSPTAARELVEGLEAAAESDARAATTRTDIVRVLIERAQQRNRSLHS